MTTLYTLAYPRLHPEDGHRIEAFRRAHDPHAALLPAHFTLVFGCDSIVTETYLRHVEAVCRQARPLDFVCRYAMPAADGPARAYVYRVPDQGFSGLSRLHDTLYRGPLAGALRLDLPYIPHITLGTADPATAKLASDRLNTPGIEIPGRVDTVTVAAMDGGELRHLAEFPLGASPGTMA
ncbi:hypothetical protein BKK81_12955 [Cupriavidus sp. USMAHM13]|uniref:2'-5' RNA ligase family protein n=1 Tax=Cupriavidus sp. USMAHM13 TaxID=1389192 RepID=UPI0008A68DE1|nr:2'-5' RNA ligase family protein [Cupriavidus sp. USMAHM13]AOZ00044.1 hypothetical protein BKK81_12955 [Cupriavidus sp. USMAHM13]